MEQEKNKLTDSNNHHHHHHHHQLKKETTPQQDEQEPPKASVVKSCDLLVDPRHHMVSLMTHDEVMGTTQ